MHVSKQRPICFTGSFRVVSTAPLGEVLQTDLSHGLRQRHIFVWTRRSHFRGVSAVFSHKSSAAPSQNLIVSVSKATPASNERSD